MTKKTIITLTNHPIKWAKFQRNNKTKLNLIISEDIQSREIANAQNKTDLLIISQNNPTEKTLDIQSISSYLGAPYTLVVAPEQEEYFVCSDLPRIASSLLTSTTTTATETPTPGIVTDDQTFNTNDTAIIQQASGALKSTSPDSPAFALFPGFDPALSLNGYLLGPFHLLINGLILNDFAGRKTKSLLAYLLYNNRRPSFRETLMEKFWPDVGAESARNSLNVAIHGIRRIFKALIPKKDLLLYKHDRYFINPDINLKLDYEDFRIKVKRGRHIENTAGIQDAISDYEEAARLYKGDFMEDSFHDEWSYGERESIKEHYLYVLDRLSDHYCSSGRYKIAQHYCRKLLDKERCREDIHRRMMRCLFLTGYRDLAVKQFKKCESALLNDLDIYPSQETLKLLEEIKRS